MEISNSYVLVGYVYHLKTGVHPTFFGSKPDDELTNTFKDAVHYEDLDEALVRLGLLVNEISDESSDLGRMIANHIFGPSPFKGLLARIMVARSRNQSPLLAYMEYYPLKVISEANEPLKVVVGDCTKTQHDLMTFLAP